jgi:hypothetical protein
MKTPPFFQTHSPAAKKEATQITSFIRYHSGRDTASQALSLSFKGDFPSFNT